MITETSITDFMTEYELTVDDMAALTGRSRRTVYNWIAGTHEMPASARLLIKALDKGIIPFEWIVNEINGNQNHKPI
jgi:DNA-binding transcriptional regulator YiaG